MPATKIAEAAELAREIDRRRDDAFKVAAGLCFKRGDHSVRRLSHGHYKDAVIGIKIMQIFANAQYVAFAMHIAGESAFDGGVAQRGGKNFTRNATHMAELLIALRGNVGHGKYEIVGGWS